MSETPHVIGHRGASAYARDNTLESIRLAASMGATMVEVDLLTTADGVVVLSHDDVVTRHNGTVRLIEQTAAQDCDLVRLDEAVALCSELGIGLYLEIKDRRAATLAPQIVEARRFAPPVVYASFRPDWIVEARAVAGEPCETAILFSSLAVNPIALARSCRASILHPCWEREARPSQLLTTLWLLRARAARLRVVTWHEERPHELAVLARLPLFGICTNTPDVLATTIRDQARALG